MNTDVTAKTVHIFAPKSVRHANIQTVHAVVMQVGADPTVVLVFILLFLVREHKMTHRYPYGK